MRNPKSYMLPKWRAGSLATLKTNLPKLWILMNEDKEGALGGSVVVRK